eukprot:SAG31_NODE_2624_length_5360_cov_2.184946_7_plen_279_part_00
MCTCGTGQVFAGRPVLVANDPFGQKNHRHEQTYAHTKNNLLHLMKPHAKDLEAKARGNYSHVPQRENIKFLHNVTHADGSRDIVHFNVHHRLGVVSLDFVPAVSNIVCGRDYINVHLSDMSAADDWTVGFPIVGSEIWGCADTDSTTPTPESDNEVENADDAEDAPAATMPMPFYREMHAIARDASLGVVRIATQNISLFQLFHGRFQVSHTPASHDHHRKEDDDGVEEPPARPFGAMNAATTTVPLQEAGSVVEKNSDGVFVNRRRGLQSSNCGATR